MKDNKWYESLYSLLLTKYKHDEQVLSSGLQFHLIWQKFTDSSEEHTASTKAEE
jgi:hypothetical protein